MLSALAHTRNGYYVQKLKLRLTLNIFVVNN